MKKTLSIVLSIVLMMSCFAINSMTALASTKVEDAIEIDAIDTVFDLQTTYDKNQESAVCWASFTPETSGLYIFNVPVPANEDYIIFTTMFKSYEGAKAYDWGDMKDAEGYIFNEEQGMDGDVFKLLGKHTYYIQYEVWDFENPTLERVISTSIIKHEHTYKTFKDKATYYWDGEYGEKCSVCDAKKNTTTIPCIDTVKLSTTSYTYNGKSKKPTVTVKDRKGKKLVNGTDYTVSYSSGRTKVGKYTVTVKFKGNYEDSMKKTFTIKPKSTSISSLTAGKKSFTVKWKKQSTQTTGYQIQYSTSEKFTNAKTYTLANNSKTSKKIGDLRGGKKYYVRVRTYKKMTINGKATKIYSSWSKTKAVTTKRF